MPVLQVFDRPLCCATGVCGVDVDQALVTFAADLDWVRAQGAPVNRANLAQQPLEFAQRPPIRHLLETEGEKALPAVLVDGELKSSGRYPSRDELAGWAGLASRLLDKKDPLAAIPVTAAAPTSSSSCCAPAPAAAAAGSRCC